MRCARAIAWASVVGLSWGSEITTTDAYWMSRPTPPASIWATSTAPCRAAENASTVSCRLVAGTDPDSGPNTGPGSDRATRSSTSRK
ncbi:hypothetical protein DFJ66_8477 [Saccharothrix variisporea]|uniref:Uncharacterized protein n=1 Tax=Saccharothrix variisporea TaxID=543527 RepID=A0A495XN83_9PSEU|nr:hypothetical protein DFJ66_8477 [Saccharothrix variisporea]